MVCTNPQALPVSPFAPVFPLFLCSVDSNLQVYFKQAHALVESSPRCSTPSMPTWTPTLCARGPRMSPMRCSSHNGPGSSPG